MWQGLRLAVVLPTYNEALSIQAVVRGFEQLGIVDDIVVVNNNAAHGTSEAVSGTSAREIHERRQGYGSAIQRGLAETGDADLVVICEPDGTFEPADLWKLLPFLSDSDAVLGSRTVQTFIYEGANMGLFLRYGNWAVAKLVEVLFNTVSLSDVGCTFRVMRRSVIDQITPDFERHESSFGLEMMLHLVRQRVPLTQVPVRYLPRVGISSVTGDLAKTITLGMEMIVLVLRFRLLKSRPPK